jgi:hypothetical protein
MESDESLVPKNLLSMEEKIESAMPVNRVVDVG